jgi:hypothetical protein
MRTIVCRLQANAIINGFDSKIITYQGDLYSALVTAGKTARDFDLIAHASGR